MQGDDAGRRVARAPGGRWPPAALAASAALLLAAALAHAGDWGQGVSLRGFASNELAGETLEGQPLLLQFWESWCRSCGQLMDDMDEVAARFPAVRYLAVSTDDDPADARERLVAHPLFARHPDRFFHDTSGRLAAHFDVKTVPTVLVIGADGRERLRHSGHFNAGELGRLVSLLETLAAIPARSTR